MAERAVKDSGVAAERVMEEVETHRRPTTFVFVKYNHYEDPMAAAPWTISGASAAAGGSGNSLRGAQVQAPGAAAAPAAPPPDFGGVGGAGDLGYGGSSFDPGNLFGGGKQAVGGKQPAGEGGGGFVVESGSEAGEDDDDNDGDGIDEHPYDFTLPSVQGGTPHAASRPSSAAAGSSSTSGNSSTSQASSSKASLPTPNPLHIGGAQGRSGRSGGGGKKDSVGMALDRFTTEFATQQDLDRRQQAALVRRAEKEAALERAHQMEMASRCNQQ